LFQSCLKKVGEGSIFVFRTCACGGKQIGINSQRDGLFHVALQNSFWRNENTRQAQYDETIAAKAKLHGTNLHNPRLLA
jgi:hypothetical protein